MPNQTMNKTMSSRFLARPIVRKNLSYPIIERGSVKVVKVIAQT